ncbi:MAG: FAD-dependent oxidoreductase [Anaerolineales bacterium]|jgi:sarcosine oxidase subunit beta
MSNTADIIIIGAGVQGASLAFHLAERGVKALVLEKNFVGAGATGRSSGMVRMHYDVRQDSELAWASFEYFKNWAEIVGGDSGFTRTGFIQLVAREHEETLRLNTAMNQEIGIPTFLISADDVKRLVPYFVTDDFDIAAYEPESGYADPSATTASLINAAKEKGARIVQNCSVIGILVESGKVKGVNTSQGDFFAPAIVNTAGPWADKVNTMVGLDFPLTTWRHDTAFVGVTKEMGYHFPAVIDFPNEMYFRPEIGGLMLVGLEDGNPLGDSPDGDTDHAIKGFIERAIDRICQRIPRMENSYLHTAHGGYDGITPDQHPLIGQAGPEGFYLQCGMSGTGFKIAPAIGLCMSELILDGESKSIDISIYRPQRFEEGDEIKGNYISVWH